MARKLEVILTGSSRDLEQALSRAGKSANDFGDRMSSMAKRAALAAGAAGLAGLAVAAKVGFAELAEGAKMAAQTEAVLKSTGGVAGMTAASIDKLAGSLMRKSGVDDEQIKAGENWLLTFKNVRNEAGKGNDIFTQATKTALDLAVAQANAKGTSVDMAQASNLLGKALNDPIKGVSALTKVGVTFTTGQKEQIKALVESGRGMDAQKLILAELTAQVGGSAEAMGKTFPGKVNIAKETLKNLAGTIVQGATPAISALSDRISKWASNADNIAKVQATVEKITRAVGEAIRAAIPVVQNIAHWIGDAVDKMGGWENAFKIITGGVLTTKVLSLAGAFGSKGLMGSVMGSTGAISGKGGLLAGLRALPTAVSIAVILELFINDKGMQSQVDAALDRAHDWALKNLDPFNLIKGLGLDSMRTPYPSVAAGSPYAALKPLVDSNGKALTGKALDDANAANAKVYDSISGAAKKAAPARRTTRRTTKRDATPEPPPVDWSDLTGNGAGDGAGGAGGKAAESAKAAARKLAADLQMEAWQAAIDARKSRLEQQAKTVQDSQTYEAELAATARKGAADRQMDAWQASIDARKAKQAETADILRIVGDHEQEVKAAQVAAVKARIDAMNAAVEAARAPFAAAFGRLGQSGLRAFDAVTARLQGDLASKLKASLGEIEKNRRAITAAEQAFADFRASDQGQALTAEEQAFADFQSQRAANARAAARAEAMAITDSAERAARLRELDLNDQERGLAEAAQASRAARNEALAAQERSLAEAATVSRTARDQEAADKIAAAQADFDTAKLNLDATRDLERGHFEERLTELQTFLGTREGSTVNANAAIRKLFEQFGVDPSFGQAGVDLGNAFATGVNEQLDTVIAKAREVAAALANAAFAGKVPAGISDALARLGASSPGGVFMGGPVPSFDTGGQVLSSGVAFVHKGEVVTAAGKGSGGRGGDTFVFEIGGRELVRFTYAELLRQKGRNVSLELV